MSNTTPDITVAIVSYNTRDLLRACLRSLAARQAEGEASLEIVVADNGSADGSAAMVRAEFPDVRVIETGGNIGYGRANNAALRDARGRYVLILNSDTEAEAGALQAMRDFLDARPEAGAVGGRLILPDGTTQPSCADDPDLKSVLWEQTYLYKLFSRNRVTGGYYMTYWDYGDRRAVEQVCGACLMVRRELFRQLGGFDPRYFMYFEDTDLCVRVRAAGAQIWFLPDACFQHRLGGSSGSDWRVRARMIASYNKSRYYFFTRTRGRVQGLALKAVVLLGATLRVAAWGLLALTGRRGAREQARLFAEVWRQTRRMGPHGDAPEGAPGPPSAASCTSA
ncbi:MAG: glycosyltransferase family 2 protein [Armatimonadetes bacterium]|nr:glycosyltransferase family 2 protein [Armatimonadota bacterium]